MRIIAYTYDADVHCVACTTRRFGAFKGIVKTLMQERGQCDEHGIDEPTDSEGNLIHPVFSTDEHDFTHCGDCHQPL